VYVIGTAGHVDHGKSTLVQALTGINPDRLREEQEREMTIDLGFAWLTLPSGREVSVVDVPGHEDFIKNMLAGIGGIDVALFIVAADESVMPQTREHLAILDLLQVRHSVVALTKSDLIQDPEWLELVQEEVRDELRGTTLENANIIPVSALRGVGLDDLRRELDRILDSAEPKRDIGRPRLPIDRVFTISGFGTVVTGTLIDGRLAVGDEVLITPGDLKARVRGLQSHKAKVNEATPGSRVAANLTGVTEDDLARGQVLTRPGWLQPTELLDAQLRLVESTPWPLKHDAVVDFYTGAARAEAHVRLLDAEEMLPGQTGWVQLRLDKPVAVVRGDRYIIRLASPSITIGGGAIVQPHPERRHRRFRPEVIAQLEALAQGTPEEILLQLFGREPILEVRELVKRSNLPTDVAAQALHSLIANGQIVLLAENVAPPAELAAQSTGVVTLSAWRDLITQVQTAAGAYHQKYPLRPGLPREELKSQVRAPGTLLNQALDHAARLGEINATATTIALPEHRVTLSPDQQARVEQALADFRANPYSPPSLQQIEELLGGEVLQYLIEDGRLVKVSEDVLFASDTFAEIERRLVAYLIENQSVTVAQVRDLLGTSRKYALGLMEEMDRRRVTKRLGDMRVLR